MASAPCLRSLTRIAGCSTTVVRGNAYRATLGAAARHEYLRKYQLNLVRPDGSMIGVRASEPLEYFAMPIDLKQLSEDERLQMLAARKPKAKIVVKELIDDNFDASAYMSSDFWSTTSAPAPEPATSGAQKEAGTTTTTTPAGTKEPGAGAGKKKDKKSKSKKAAPEPPVVE
ncbi:mrpl-55 [Pristionchus pacificus]|uniref:Mrpl-55 n=1 Tax=Pristionchus pacificus TaxID=54126 RepID=A0A2A6BHI9_PRIPA|nr:mrpl-55 [Pristionchus pacificus]|eukprot:PDM65370.1 mrpl-55 [Pristionchus pacificus]